MRRDTKSLRNEEEAEFKRLRGESFEEMVERYGKMSIHGGVFPAEVNEKIWMHFITSGNLGINQILTYVYDDRTKSDDFFKKGESFPYLFELGNFLRTRPEPWKYWLRRHFHREMPERMLREPPAWIMKIESGNHWRTYYLHVRSFMRRMAYYLAEMHRLKTSSVRYTVGNSQYENYVASWMPPIMVPERCFITGWGDVHTEQQYDIDHYTINYFFNDTFTKRVRADDFFQGMDDIDINEFDLSVVATFAGYLKIFRNLDDQSIYDGVKGDRYFDLVVEFSEWMIASIFWHNDFHSEDRIFDDYSDYDIGGDVDLEFLTSYREKRLVNEGLSERPTTHIPGKNYLTLYLGNPICIKCGDPATVQYENEDTQTFCNEKCAQKWLQNTIN